MADTNMVKEMTSTPPPASAVLNNPMTLSFLGQLNSSPQLGSTSSVGSTPSPAVPQPNNPSCTSSNIMDLPNINSFTPVITSIPNTMGTSTSSSITGGQMNYPDVNRDLTVCRLGYEAQTPHQRAPCISVTVSQGMSFVNMSGSRESLLSQTSRKSLLSPTNVNVSSSSVNAFQPQSAKTENECNRSVTTAGRSLQTDSSCFNQPSPSSPFSTLSSNSTAQQVVQWLNSHRFSHFVQDFQNFSGADLLRLSRDELIQICGLADGIRLDNALQAKKIRPKLTIYVFQETEIDRLRSGSGGVRYAMRHASDSQWDALSPAGSPSCSSPYTSSSHLSSCSSDPSLPTTNQLSPRITSSSNSYLDRRRGSVQLPTISGRSMTNILSSKRRFLRTFDNSTDDDGIEGSFRKKQRTRHTDLSVIDGYYAVYLEDCTVCHLADKLAASFNIDVSQIDDMYYKGPNGINVLITDSVVQNFTDQAKYAIEVIQQDEVGLGQCRLVLKYIER